jgi:hypothetical protein
MSESELEGLQCFPFHLPDTEAPKRDRTPSYRPLECGPICIEHCGYLGADDSQPCWGQVKDDLTLTSLGSVTIRYFCQGHIKGKPWRYYSEKG